MKRSCCYEPFVLFSLNALDPKLVWHIEKETRRDWGHGRRGEGARMDREKLRVREEEHGDSEKDTGEEVETLRERKAKKTKPAPPKKNPKHQTRRKIINKISKQMNSGAQGRE